MALSCRINVAKISGEMWMSNGVLASELHDKERRAPEEEFWNRLSDEVLKVIEIETWRKVLDDYQWAQVGSATVSENEVDIELLNPEDVNVAEVRKATLHKGTHLG